MRKERGFTLVELMVVMAIILILAGIVFPKIFRRGSSTRSSEAARRGYHVTTGESRGVTWESDRLQAINDLIKKVNQGDLDAPDKARASWSAFLVTHGTDPEANTRIMKIPDAEVKEKFLAFLREERAKLGY